MHPEEERTIGVPATTQPPVEGGRTASAVAGGADFDDSLIDFVCDKMEPDVATFFRLLLKEGRNQPGDSGVSLDSKPAWVDDEKIRLGQKFAENFLFGVLTAEMASLFLLFAVPSTLTPLVFTGNSDTSLKAFPRYLSIIFCVLSWYSDDLWAEGGKARHHLQYVRRKHDRYRGPLNALKGLPAAELERRTALQVTPWTEGTAAATRQAFAAQEAAAGDALCPFFRLLTVRNEWINQLEMSITQFGFVGVAVTYPDLFGTSGASEKELDAFVHLWRVLGHLLGVEDRFNFCSGGLDAVRRRCKTIVNGFVLPAMAHVDAPWEHMLRCVVSGLQFHSPLLEFEVALAHACGIFGSEAQKQLLRHLTVRQRLRRWLLAWVLRWGARLPPLRALLNWVIRRRLQRAQKLSADPEWLREREQRFGYASFQRRCHSN